MQNPYVFERSLKGDESNLGETAFPLVIVRFAHNDSHNWKVHEVNFKTNCVCPRTKFVRGLLRLRLAKT
jgi:hypothetical protein